MPFVNELGGGIRRTIDYERNIILKDVRGWGGRENEFEIDWDGKQFRFRAKHNIAYGGEKNNIPIAIEWFIASMQIPEGLKDKRSEVMGLIKETMEVYSLLGRPNWDGTSTVKFDQRLIQVEGNRL